MFTLSLYFLLVILTTQKLSKTVISCDNENTTEPVTAAITSCRNFANRARIPPSSPYKTLLSLALILAGDVQQNPGPRASSVYPCGLCENPVTWNCRGVACDGCSIWYHGSCIELCTNDYSMLERSNVQWLCHKCDSINCTTFTFRSFSLNCSNVYSPLSDNDLTLDSMNSSTFSPLKTSSPYCNNSNGRLRNTRGTKSSLHNNSSETSSKGNRTKPRSKRNSSNIYDLPDKRHLRILTVNCQRIGNKKAELEAAIGYIKPDIICGTESWLNTNIKSSEVFPEGFTAYRKDRSRLGGGVFILVRNELISSEETDLISECESIWTRVKLQNSKDLIIGTFYMPHRNDKDLNELEKSLSSLSSKTNQKHTILTGDFNCPNINWENGSVKPSSPDRLVQQRLIDITTTANLTQMHSESTREKALLDLIFTNNPTLLRNSVSVPGIADHDMVVTDIDTKPIIIKQQKRKCFIFSKANWTSLNKAVSEIDTLVHDLITQNKSTNKVWTFFKETLMAKVDEFIPSKMTGNRPKTPWINRDIKKMLRKKHRLFKQAKKTNNWSNYKHYQRECKRTIRRAEWNYVNTIIEKGLQDKNTKPFWQYIKSRKQDNIGVAPLKDNSTPNLISDSKTKAKTLLKQFQSVFTPEDGSPLPSMETPQYEPIHNIKLNTSGIAKLLKSINPQKACGPDAIPNAVLKNCADSLAPVLTDIFQLSLDTGDLPDDWKKANISSVFKKGDKHLASNYRPVSLTSVCCKILEHVVCKHLMNHLEDNKILTNLNHGFRSGFSCESQLLTTMNDLFSAYDQGKQVDVAILDFSKAFDTVPHRKLLYKLSKYGITGPVHTWLSNFLTNRTMRVVLEGEASEEVGVESGVPQGTVLGPILFLCHINDLPLSVSSQVRLFADDCLLYRTIDNVQDHLTLQKDLENLETWAKQWGMRFNAKKCYILRIRDKLNYLFYKLDNSILQNVPSNPYLGLEISNDLEWHNHINNITRKASRTLGFLQRNLKHCPQDCRKTAYLSLIRSTLEYGAIVWDSHYKMDIDKVERIQHRAARFIKQDFKSMEQGCVTTMLKDLKLPSLQERRRQLRLIFMYKVVEGLVPAMPHNQFFHPKNKNKRQIKAKKFDDCITKNVVDKSATCNTRPFLVPNSLTEQYRNSFFVRTTEEWNHLDNCVVTATSVDNFKKRINLCD